jgi:sulfur carrier protein
MKITVKLFATLRINRFVIDTFEFPEGTTILDVADALGIPKEALALTMVNGIPMEDSHILKDGDKLSIFPPVGGG